ncbi:hypothetical protein GCM10011425_31570 [Mucilaginibacter galii]|uniref:Uncharacterized protein n=1 Tax=Mucilaginibacter galii TaxID=2005073 RepID=A0A917JCI5_9SPHI|nr:hypothetical protein GCM10011425_31570 [Mucilaginibacter galii]
MNTWTTKCNNNALNVSYKYKLHIKSTWILNSADAGELLKHNINTAVKNQHGLKELIIVNTGYC